MEQIFGQFTQSFGGQLSSILGAVIVFLLGWIVALILGAITHKLLAKMNVNQRMNSSTGKKTDLEQLFSRVVFWFVLIIAIAGALSLLNLNAISVPFANMINEVLSFLPRIIAAGILGLVGWVVATLVRTGITTALGATSLDEKLSAEAGVEPMSGNIANVFYWLILLLFLPLVLNALGLDGLLLPVQNMVDELLAFLPNLIAAGAIFVVGYIVAKILRGITTSVVSTLNIQSVAAKAGISDQTKLSSMAGMLVFLVVIIPFLIAALDALQIEAVSRPATNMLDQIMAAIPNVIAAAMILGVTYFVAKFVGNIVSGLLENTGINQLPSKMGLQDALGEYKVSSFVGTLIVFFAVLFASIEAANRLEFDRVSDLIALFINFGADILLGAVILMVGFWLANTLAAVVARSQEGSTWLANLVRVLIMGLVVAMGLRAMGIADSIVNLAFGLTLGAVAIAFALAFGIGGREAAARLLKNLQDKVEK